MRSMIFPNCFTLSVFLWDAFGVLAEMDLNDFSVLAQVMSVL